MMKIEDEKITEALISLESALNNLQKGDKRAAIGSLTIAKEKCKETVWLLEDQLINENEEGLTVNE